MKGDFAASASLWFALGAALIGGLIYGTGEGKVAELGRLTLFVGLFFLVWTLAGKVSP